MMGLFQLQHPFSLSLLFVYLLEKLVGSNALSGNAVPISTGDFWNTAFLVLIGIHRVWTAAVKYCYCHVEIEDFNETFTCMLNWVSQHPSLLGCRSLLAVDGDDPTDRADQLVGSTRVWTYQLGYDAPILVWYHGWPVWVRRVRQSRGESWVSQKLVIFCLGRDTQLIQMLLSQCEENHRQEQESKLQVRRPQSAYLRRNGMTLWGKPTSEVPTALEELYLEEGKKEKIVQRSKNHFEGHLGGAQLWYGPPGNGKSTLAGAIAFELKCQLCLIELSDPSLTQSDLVELVSKLTKAVLLIEDVSSQYLTEDATVSHPRMEAHCENGGISETCLRGILDMIAKKPGVVLIMTSNYTGARKGPLLRSGRIDHEEYFGNPTEPVMFAYFKKLASKSRDEESAQQIAGDFAAALSHHNLSFAEIKQFVRENREDTETVMKDLPSLIDKAARKGSNEGPDAEA